MKDETPSKGKAKLNLNAIVAEFQNLDPRDPGLWPLVPRVVILVGIFSVVLLLGWWFGWSVQQEELDKKRQEEETLKEDWKAKKLQAVNIEEYRKQLEEINNSFGALLKQLPNAAEMESLLVDINQAGVMRGLQFDLFKPGIEVLQEFYAELPITIKLRGSYHDLGAFTGDIAKLSRVVTLNDIDISPNKEANSGLAMSAVAKTFRYLDDSEVSKQKKDKQDKAKAGGN